jgi:hypothetical protein
LNKTGVIPSQTTTTNIIQTDFRMSAVSYPTGAAYNLSVWPGNPSGNNSPVFADSPTSTNFAALQAFNTYTAEIYVNGSTTPIIETTRIQAPIESPSAYVKRPLHDLSPSLGLITPPQAATANINAQWIRNPLAVRLSSAYIAFSSTSGFATSFADLPDSISAGVQTSTNINIPIAQGTAPGYTTTGAATREIGLTGNAARARFNQSITWSN